MGRECYCSGVGMCADFRFTKMERVLEISLEFKFINLRENNIVVYLGVWGAEFRIKKLKRECWDYVF